jgi:hypothetical protein
VQPLRLLLLCHAAMCSVARFTALQQPGQGNSNKQELCNTRTTDHVLFFDAYMHELQACKASAGAVLLQQSPSRLLCSEMRQAREKDA